MPRTTCLNFGTDRRSLEAFAMTRDGFACLRRGADIRLNGYTIRVTPEPDGLKATYCPRFFFSTWVPGNAAAGRTWAQSVASAINDNAGRQDPVREMVRIVERQTSDLAKRYYHAVETTHSIHPSGLLNPSTMLEEARLNSRSTPRPPSAIDDSAGPVRDDDDDSRTPASFYRHCADTIGFDAAEADYLCANLDNGILCSDNFVGHRIDEGARAIDICFAINATGSDASGKPVLERVAFTTDSKGELKAHVRPLTEAERLRYMAEDGDLREQAVWIRLKESDETRLLLTLIKNCATAGFRCLRELLGALLVRLDPDPKYGPECRANNMTLEMASELTRTEWNAYTAAAERVFELSNLLSLGELSADAVAALLPALFKDLWVVMVPGPDGAESPKLANPSDLIALADRKVDFFACLHNELLASQHIPYKVGGKTFLVRDVMGTPNTFRDDAAFRHWITTPAAGHGNPFSTLLRFHKICVSNRHYVVALKPQTTEISVHPVDASGAEVPHGDPYARELGEFLTAQHRFSLRRFDAFADFKVKFDGLLAQLRQPVYEENGMPTYAIQALNMIAPPDATAREELRARLSDGQYCRSTFIGFEKGLTNETFVAVFKRLDGGEGRLTLSNRNIPGKLSGDELKRRLKDSVGYNSLIHLAAQWIFEKEQASIRLQLFDALDEVARPAGPGSAVDEELRDAVLRDSAELSLSPFADKTVLAFLKQEYWTFASVADVDALVGDDATVDSLKNAGKFVAAGRTFSVLTMTDGAVRISEASRSLLQAIKAIFRLDDAARLTRSIKRQAAAKMAAEKIQLEVEKIVGPWFEVKHMEGVDLNMYSYDAIGHMTMARDARAFQAKLAQGIDDPFFCQSNFRGIQAGAEPDTFVATFADAAGNDASDAARNPARQERIVFSNLVDFAVAGRLQGAELKLWLSRCQYDCLHDLIKKWTAQQAKTKLQDKLERMAEFNVPGHEERLAGYRPLYRELPDGSVVNISKRPLYEVPAAV
jgi:hypothetical protein